MSRVAKSVKNVKISLVFLIATTLLGFFSRSIFINSLGDSIVGLSATLTNILGFLNLAELGLASAIGSTLFKPLHDNDREVCCDVVSIYAYLYRIIGCSILGIGIVVSLFLPIFFGNSGVDLIYVYCGYFTYLTTSLLGYFINYKQTILSASQQEYKITFRYNIIFIFKILIQIAVLKLFTTSFLVWLAIELVFGILYSLWISQAVNKHFNWLVTSYKRGREASKNYKHLFKTIWQVIPHNIGAFVLFQTDNILIYAYSSLAMVTMYTNYVMILDRTRAIVNTTLRGVYASVGNLVAAGDKNEIKKVFFEFQSMLTIIATVVVTVFLFQTDAFVTLWLGNNYVLSNMVLYLMLYAVYVGIIRLPVSYFLGAYVLYKDIWAPIAEATINLVVSLLFGYYYGIVGVVFGTAVSLTAIVVIWKPIFLYNQGFNEQSTQYWALFFKNICLLGLTIAATHYFIEITPLPNNSSWVGFVLKSFIIVFFSGLLFVSLSLLCDQGTKNLAIRTKTLILKKIIKK